MTHRQVKHVGDEETRGYGWSLLGMVVASMVLQLCVVLMQNKGMPWVPAKEMLIVMTGLKPAFMLAACVLAMR